MYIEGMNYNQEELLAQGEKKAKLEDARNMLLDHVDVNKVSKYTGLSVNEVKTIVGAN